MPELPEVEVLVRHLHPLLRRQRVRAVSVHRAKTIAPSSVKQLSRALVGARFEGVTRRGKYILFTLGRPREKESLLVLGHLGMTGRMYLLPGGAALPEHAAISLNLGAHQFVLEDTRYFGRFTLDTTPLARLGPEPLEEEFTVQRLAKALASSAQPVKIRLLDQSVLAGVGNIYASEALFRAGIPPSMKARNLTSQDVARLWLSIREVLGQAIALGSTVPLDFPGRGKRNRLFYYGSAPGAQSFYEERLQVYDRQNLPCRHCGTPIRRIVQAGRSTFFCPRCQRTKSRSRRGKSV